MINERLLLLLLPENYCLIDSHYIESENENDCIIKSIPYNRIL